MASVTSLGLHQPTGLQYAIQERLVPPDAPSNSYTWLNYCEESGSSYNDDELLVTTRSVVWSRGGIFRKCYKFDLEGEEVTQALLTTFPSLGPLPNTDTKGALIAKPREHREAAIVAFLKTQAHVYFLSGASHVIHLPFEVESAIATPNGLIIQRKLRVDNLVAASLKFPRVPPNSFVSSQPQPWSAASSQQSTFSIADLGAPKQLNIPHSTLKDMWDPPSLKDDSNWPRLFSLSDPLSEMGLVVAQDPKKENRRNRRSSTKISALNTAEEILHVSRRDEFSSKTSSNPLVLALTLNRETSMYTIWKLAYLSEDSNTPQKQRVTSGTMSRRRSSFVPGTGTGATTPVANSQPVLGETFGGNAPIGTRKTVKIDESKDQVADLVSSLDPDFESNAVPRRKSRRVSSMLARADLSASHERSVFTELASGHQPNRRGESLGSQHVRNSIGQYAGANGASFTQPVQFNQSLNSYLEAPVDDLLDELRAGGDFEGFHNMGLDDEEFDALRQEIVLTPISTVAAEHSNVRYSTQHMPAASQCRIFTLTAPPSAADDKQGNTIVICIHDPDEKKLLVLTLYLKVHKANVDLSAPNTASSDRDVHVVTLGNVMRAKGVIDACRIDDGQVSRILVLTETPDGYGELSLQAPWSILMKVPLPSQFTINNARNLSHNSVPHTKREGGLKRVFSQGPRALRGLRNAKHGGLVDLVDEVGKMHQLQFMLQARNPHICSILETCRAVLPASRGGENILVFWWNAIQWFRLESFSLVDIEWSALTITLFGLALAFGVDSNNQTHSAHAKKKSRGFLRSSSGAQSDTEDWDLMLTEEASNGNPIPEWASNNGWKWLADLVETDDMSQSLGPCSSIFQQNGAESSTFTQRHVKLARDFANTRFGHDSIAGCLPTSGNRQVEVRKAALVDIFVGLHLWNEEQKLDTTKCDSLTTGLVSLVPTLAQLSRWLGWDSWIQYYECEEASLVGLEFDHGEMAIHLQYYYKETD